MTDRGTHQSSISKPILRVRLKRRKTSGAQDNLWPILQTGVRPVNPQPTSRALVPHGPEPVPSPDSRVLVADQLHASATPRRRRRAEASRLPETRRPPSDGPDSPDPPWASSGAPERRGSFGGETNESGGRASLDAGGFGQIWCQTRMPNQVTGRVLERKSRMPDILRYSQLIYLSQPCSIM